MSESAGMETPDLREKLYYLISQHGDQRPLPDNVKIRSMDRLSDEFKHDRTRLERWCKDNRIPDPAQHVPKLCRIFAIEQAWLRLPFAEFLEACQKKPLVGWAGLIALARERDVGEVTLADAGGSAQAAEPDHNRNALPEDLPEPEFVADRGSRIQVTLRTPRDERGVVSWRDWHTVLFSQDTGGYHCLLPRYEGLQSMPPARIPPTGALQMRLKLEPDKGGKHAFVLVALKAELPPSLMTMLREAVEDEELKPTLERLGRYALPLVRVGEAGVLRLPYRVR